MIRSSFIFLERIGNKKEKAIWNSGIKSWDDFLNAKKVRGIGKKAKPYYNRKLIEARKELYEFNSAYFTNILPKSEHWRLYDFFKEEVVFLDIETDGIDNFSDITVVGLFDGITTKTMIRGINLDFKKLKEELKKYKLIVSFNGSVFDIPFLRKRHDVLPAIPHFDLRFACSRIGLKGGLKEIERTLGIKRNHIVERIYNGDALTLYRMYRGSGDDYYLNLLVEYNEEDVINLKYIADVVYKKLKESCLPNCSYTFQENKERAVKPLL